MTEIQEVEHVASKLLHRYFCERDTSFLIDSFTEDIVCLGNGERQSYHGIAEVSSFFRKGKTALISCRLLDDSYITVRQSADLYLCETQFRLEPLDLNGASSLKNRITFLFRRENGIFRTSSIHFSEVFYVEESLPAEPTKTHFVALRERVGEQKQQIELMLQQLPGGMLFCTPEAPYTISWVSDTFSQLLGYENPDQLLNENSTKCAGFIHPEDAVAVCAEMQTELQCGNTYSVEYRVVRRDGSSFWVMDIGNILTDTNGKRVVSCFIADISRRVERERQLRQANQKIARQAQSLSQLYATVPCGIVQFVLNPSPQIITMNPCAMEIYGYDEKQTDIPHEEICHSILHTNLLLLQNTVDEMLRNGGRAVYERKVSREDGEERWVNAILVSFTNADGLRVIQAMITDITENRKLQSEREQKQYIENRSLWTAVRTAYQLIMQINLSQNSFEGFSNQNYITSVKETGALDELVRHTTKGISPVHYDDFLRTFSPDHMLEHFAAGGKELYMELQRKGDDDAYHWVSIHCIRVAPEISTDVLLILLVKVLDDQRAEKAQQEKLLRDALLAAQEASRAKSDFLSRMSHDIRTPMNAIIGMSTIGQLKIVDSERVQDCFRKIDASSRYLLGIINDILDMSRIESGKMVISRGRFNLPELMNQIDVLISPYAQTCHVVCKILQIEPLNRYYVGDALRINQVLMNLLSNALKFTQEGGQVSLCIREQSREQDVARIAFTISDNGLGMSETFMERMFRPFEQERADNARNKAGSGLGLSIVQSLVHLMDGSIAVQSKEGIGTTFTIVLPFGVYQETLEGAVLSDTRPADTVMKSLLECTGKRLLLVEDNEINMEIARSILEMQGILIDPAENGQIAVQKFQESVEGHYQGILMDIRMPVLDGLEATRVIRLLPRSDSLSVPIIAMSANAFDEDKALAIEAGMNDYIIKPIELDALFSTLQRWIDHP